MHPRPHRRPRRPLVAAAAALAAAALAGAGLALGAGGQTVRLTAAGPSPQTVTVGVGDTVSFVGADADNHSIVSSGGGFTSPVIHPGETWTRTMGAPGRFPYDQTGFGKSRHGLIVVEVEGALSLEVTEEQVVFGGSVRLTGRSPLPGYDVVVEARTAAARDPSSGSAAHGGWAPLQTVHAGADGSFALTLRPEVTTRYRATLETTDVRSSSLQVSVAPRVTARPARRSGRTGSFGTVTARIVPADAATALELLAFDARRGRWHAVQTRPVAKGSATFRWRLAQGKTMLRVATVHGHVRAGLTAGAGRSFAVTGLGAAAAPKKHTAHRHHRKTQG